MSVSNVSFIVWMVISDDFNGSHNNKHSRSHHKGSELKKLEQFTDKYT